METFIVVFISILVSKILWCFGEDIFEWIILGVDYILYVIIYIVTLPVRGIIYLFSARISKDRIILNYESIFSEKTSLKAAIKTAKTTRKLELKLNEKLEVKQDKQAVKMLNKVKWVL